ncbi:hypothetical protein [Nocardioides rubriscoriae]|uniref:hypothetical protein n=1 Tax=Nocardioides rubriscoriae TaxID=642762 RepID=UPI0011E03DAC|nr:hypothetical protein [Nocardioides rubriscoriae]
MPLTSARYAAVTSTLALVVALGGTSYAAVRIGTKDLRDNAVTSVKIKNGAVTGADVKESTLGRVPNADTAVRAQEAGVVDGTTITTVDTSQDPGPGRPAYVFQSADFTIELTCTVAGGITRTGLAASTSLPGGYVSTVAVTDSAPPTVLQADMEGLSFNPGQPFDLLAGDDGDTAQVSFVYSNAAGSRVSGTLSADVTINPDDDCSATGVVLAH